MKTKIFFLALLLAGCATTPDTSKLVKPREWQRIQIARFDSAQRSEVLDVDVLFKQPVRPHKTIALLTVEGAAREEAVLVNAIGYHARILGADALILLDNDSPNAGLAIAHPLYQSVDRRVSRANAIVYDK